MKCERVKHFASYLHGHYSSNSNWGFKLPIANCFVNAKELQNKYVSRETNLPLKYHNLYRLLLSQRVGFQSYRRKSYAMHLGC